VPIDDEQADFALAVTEEAKRSVQAKLVSSGVAGALSLIPGVGAAVTELLTELAIQRTNDRIKEMFDYFANKIRDMGEEKVNHEWFRSEEFQTLLYEAIQQLHAIHDRRKIEMLGFALANSGESEFRDVDKDLFVRLVRDISQHQSRLLLGLAPDPPRADEFPPDPQIEESKRKEAIRRWMWDRRPTVAPRGDDLLALQILHAYGIVEETRKSSIKVPSISSISSASGAVVALKTFAENIEKAPITRHFRLTPLGDEFLSFTGLRKGR
jgi:hypothetical protein